MKTTYDIQNILYKVLSSSTNITETITGGVYKKRPLNSKQEDIIVGSLPVGNDDIQRAVGNVNIHVPNLIIDVNGVQDNSQPNLKRLNEITRLAWGLLDESYYEGYWFYVQQQSIFEEGNEHYSNIRIEFYSVNTTN